MTTRRRRGSGTIWQGRDGYRASFSFAGKREEIEGSPFATYDAAETALDALLAALADAGAVRGGVTLRKLGEKALAQRELDGYRSVDSEREIWDLRVETWEQAGLPASATTRGDVRAWLAAMRNVKTKKPLAAQTRRNALNLLRAVYAYGVDNEIVSENPCDDVRVKDHGSTREGSTFLSADEAVALIDAATDPGVALAIGTGMRSGELRALRWTDVHERHITVRYGSPEMPTKNGRSRDIPILPIAAKALEQLGALRDTRSGVAVEKVLPAMSGGYRARAQVFDRIDWKVWLKAAKITRRVRPHDLRHTCATLLLTGAWGRAWTYEEVKEMLGHSSVKVTERYAKATGTRAERAAAEMIGAQKARNEEPPEVAQAREIIRRCGWDLNPHMPVLQTEHPPQDFRDEPRLARLTRAYDPHELARAFVAAVAEGSAHAIARGLDLAESVLDSAAERAADARRA